MYYGEEIGMTDSKLPFNSALDPIPHKFKFVPRILLDTIGLTINRDEVRTPMQWDGTKNAGFSSAEKTWLPVHENYKEVNVEAECSEKRSLLNVVRDLLKLRKHEKALQEGSLELIENLPDGVLGYARKLGEEKITTLLNFDDREKRFEFENMNCIFKLSPGDEITTNTIRLDGVGGTILKESKSGLSLGEPK